jgi:hypothetical protein
MMSICEAAQLLWQACLDAVNSGRMDEYVDAWSAYQAHKRNCKECKNYLHEYLLRFDVDFRKQHSTATKKGMRKC